MYFTLLLTAITIAGHFTGWLFRFWLGCSICSAVIWMCMYYKSLSDYAYLAAERWRMLILFQEVRTKGFDNTMKQSYYFLEGMSTHWIIIACYIRKLHLYSTSQTHWFTKQWIAKLPPDLEISLLELEAQRELCSADALSPMLTEDC